MNRYLLTLPAVTAAVVTAMPIFAQTVVPVIGGGGTFTGTEIAGIQRTFLEPGYTFLTSQGTLTIQSRTEILDPVNPPIIVGRLPFTISCFNGNSVTFNYDDPLLTLNAVSPGDSFSLAEVFTGGSVNSTIPGVSGFPSSFVVRGNFTSTNVTGACPSNCSFTLGTSLASGLLTFGGSNTLLGNFIPPDSPTSDPQVSFQPSTNFIDPYTTTGTTTVSSAPEPVYVPTAVNTSQRNLATASSFGLSNNLFLIPSLPIVPSLSGATGTVDVDYEINTVVTSQAIGIQSRVVPNLVGAEGSTPLVKSVQIPAVSTQGKNFEVIVDNVNLGTFRPGQVINFANFRTQLGSLLVDFEGVRKFKIRVKEDVATTGTARLPFLARLEFTKPSANLELRTARVN